MSDRDVIEADDVRQVVRADAGASPGPRAVSAGGTAPATLRDFKEWSERAYLVDRLREHEWNISKTAEVIDTPRSNLYKKLEQYGITQESDG
jgi:two-component system, NtrC family, nitrogen regulation response regulator NtrX